MLARQALYHLSHTSVQISHSFNTMNPYPSSSNKIIKQYMQKLAIGKQHVQYFRILLLVTEIRGEEVFYYLLVESWRET
jgi:hypothetical protein